MEQNCKICGKSIEYGDSVYRIALGTHVAGFITPSGEKIELDIHQRCVADELSWQAPPYQCDVCGVPLKSGDRVLYATVGTKPLPRYQRLERRGYELPFIAHEDCGR